MNLRLTHLLGAVSAVCLLGSAVSQSLANGIYLSTDKFSYSGTVTRYNTIEDAKAGINSIGGPYSIPSVTNPPYTIGDTRDGAAYFANGHPFASDHNVLMTAWYYTPALNKPAYSGWGNPNNTNTGFVQLYDVGGTTHTTFSGGWTSLAYDTFVLSVQGQNAGAPQYARFWHAPNLGGASGLTAGIFLEYDIYMQATGLNGQQDANGFITHVGHAADLTGYFRGYFQNNSSVDPSLHGIYAFDLAFTSYSWAYDMSQQGQLVETFEDSVFSAAPIPEPAFFQMGALAAFGGLGLLRLRRKS